MFKQEIKCLNFTYQLKLYDVSYGFIKKQLFVKKGTWYCGIAYGIISWLAYLTWNFKRLHVKYIVHKFDFLSNSIFAHFYF